MYKEYYEKEDGLNSEFIVGDVGSNDGCPTIGHSPTFLDLDRIAHSDKAKALIANLVDALKPKLGPKPRLKGLSEAAGAIVAGLLEVAADDPAHYVFRPMERSHYTGKAIGFRPFKKVLDALVCVGLVDYIPGTCPVRPTKDDPRLAARIRAKPDLLELASAHGIDPAAWEDHFRFRLRPSTLLKPILLKAATRKRIRMYKVEKIEGDYMPVSLADPVVASLANDVNALNAFLSKQDIQPDRFYRGLHRIFHDGDLHLPYRWNKGGRLYDLGRGAGYQSIKKDERKRLTINGAAVAEVDLKGSHPRILHALKGEPIGPLIDPYEISSVPRNVVKLWSNMTLGYSKFHSRWTDDAKEAYREDGATKGCDLQKDYPYSKTQKLILEEMALLKDWPASPWRWGDLQYIESCILMDAMKDLCLEQGIPALPLHDSLIVPVPHIEAAKKALSDAFFKHLGVWPGITVK